jgi:hypothetical protein
MGVYPFSQLAVMAISYGRFDVAITLARRGWLHGYPHPLPVKYRQAAPFAVAMLTKV